MNVSKRRILSSLVKSRTIDIQGSEARDSLSNERTFLAWLRTAFAAAAVGIVLVRFELNNPGSTDVSEKETILSKITACIFLILGLLCIIVGSARYAIVQVMMENGKYPTAGSIILIISATCTVAFILTFVIFVL